MKNYQYILTHSSGNLTPDYSPLNWDRFNVMFKRSKRYHSMLRRQIIDNEFPRDGKVYIDSIYETYGIDTDIGCEIQYLDKLTRTYSTLFNGIIDLSDWKSLRDTTSVKIIDSSTLALFAIRDDIEVAINRTEDLDGESMAVYDYLNTFNVEGVDIEEKAEFVDSDNDITIDDVENADFHNYYGVTSEDYDFNTIGVDAVLPAVILPGAAGICYTNTTGSTQSVRYRFVVAIEGNVEVIGSGGWTWKINVKLGKTGSLVTPITRSESGTGNSNIGVNSYVDTGEVSVPTLLAGETIEFYLHWEGTVGSGDRIEPHLTYTPSRVEISIVDAGKAATSPSIPLLHELGAKLLEIMTGQADPLNSALLGRTDSEPRTYGSDGDYSLVGVASGLNLRGFPNADYPLKTTFKEYFKSIDALYNLGMWHDGTDFVISAKEDYYKTSKIITLGEVQGLEKSVAAEHYFNQITCGYKKNVSYEDVNGQQVPNVPVKFSNDGKRISNILDLQSVYRGDDYGIELARNSPYSTTSGEDTRYDEEKFIINGKRTGGHFQTQQGFDNFDEIDGVYSPSTRLNLDITPKRNLLRHLNQLSIPLFVTNGDTPFMSSQFELDLSTKKAAVPAVEELADLAYSDLEEPLYYPEIYNFTSELSIENVLQLISDPHGYVEFEYLGVTYSGWILEVSTEPFNRKGNWTLIKRNPNR